MSVIEREVSINGVRSSTTINGKYSVYEHVFPDGKRYIGISSTDPQTRWKNGEGYRHNDKMYEEIKKVGWNNIQHNVIVSGILQKQATDLEKYLIKVTDSIKNGFNLSTGGEHCQTHYSRTVNKRIAELKTYSRFIPELMDCANMLEELGDDEDFSIRLNEIDRKIRAIPDWKGWESDQYMRIIHWWTTVQYALLGGNMNKLTSVSDVSTANLARKLFGQSEGDMYANSLEEDD